MQEQFLQNDVKQKCSYLTRRNRLSYMTSQQCCGSESAWIRFILVAGSATKSKAGSESVSKSKFRSRESSKTWSYGGSRTLTMEAWRLKMEPQRVCIPIVAHLYHFDEEQDPDPDPDSHQCVKRDPNPRHSVSDPQHYFALQTLSFIF